MNTLFCRHNRFTADCPICSKGTLLDPDRSGASRRRSTGGSGTTARRAGGRATAQPGGARFKGPFAATEPLEDEEGRRYEVRLEKVPGGVRLAEWSGGELRRRAPVLPEPELRSLVATARERDLLAGRDLDALEQALSTEQSPQADESELHGASPGRAGELRDELRVELVDDGVVRVGRWMRRPGIGFELTDAPVMLPAKRFAEALRDAARRGVLSGA